jgi:Phosphodiester glycosidase
VPPLTAERSEVRRRRRTGARSSTGARSLWLGALLVLLASGRGFAAPVSYARCSVAGVSLHVITADLNDARVVVAPAMASRGSGHAESFSVFISRLQPAAAINGTFFSKTTLRPIGDVVADGRLLHFGGMGTAIAFAPTGVDVIRLPHSRRVDWAGYRSALAAGPLLVWDGFAKQLPGGEGFGDPHVFASAAPRSALGITRANKLLLVATIEGTSLAKLARAMRALGAVYAVNLDGGSSVGLWYEGQTVRAPGRDLTNVLCVYVRPEGPSRPLLRPPRGLDWRTGHKQPPLPGFRAAGLKVSVALPRDWEGEQVVRVTTDKPLPEGHSALLVLNDKVVATSETLPTDFRVNVHATRRYKHLLCVEIVDGSGHLLGRLQQTIPGHPPD